MLRRLARATRIGIVGFASMSSAQEQLMAAYKAAVAAHQQHDFDTALSKYRQVLSMQPAIAAVHNNVAAILLSRGEKAEAESSWRSAVKYKPEYAEAHYNLAVLLSEKAGDVLFLVRLLSEKPAALCSPEIQ